MLVSVGGDSDSKNSESSDTAFAVTTPEIKAAHPNNAECSSSSSGNAELHLVSSSQERQDTGCLGSFRDASFRSFRMALEASADPGARETQAVESPMPRASSDDTEGEAELEEEESQELDRELSVGDISLNRFANKRELSRKRREYLRFMDVKRNKELVFYERVKGRRVNILEGLELHDGVFDAAEQKRIVDFVYELQDMGRRGKLKGWYSLLCR